MVLDDKQAPRKERCLVVFADDWGRHPSSCQHLVRELLDTCDVAWINTVGTRGLSFDVDLLRRGAQKLRQWTSGSAEKREASPATAVAAPTIHNPPMYPGFRTRWQRRLNARMLASYLKKKLPRLRESVVLSAVPITADLPEHVDARRWIYYCVDDFSAWPGLDAAPLAHMEQRLVKRADRIVAAGANLAARVSGMGRQSEVISHGIDLTHWTRTDGSSALVAALQRPLVLFWGLVDRRLDFDAVAALDRRMTEGSIVFVGPQQNPDPRLRALRRVHLAGPAAFEDLPALARESAVLVMPYADLPVTRAMQPLKLKEYLATGRPVVVKQLPAVAAWEDCMDVATDNETFVDLVLSRLDGRVPEAQARARARLRDETWRAKSARFADILFGD